MPRSRSLLAPMPDGVRIVRRLGRDADVIVAFHTTRRQLDHRFDRRSARVVVIAEIADIDPARPVDGEVVHMPADIGRQVGIFLDPVALDLVDAEILG